MKIGHSPYLITYSRQEEVEVWALYHRRFWRAEGPVMGRARGVHLGSELGRITRTQEARLGPHLITEGLCCSSVLGGEQCVTSLYSWNVCLLMSLWTVLKTEARAFYHLPSWAHTYHKTHPNHSLATKNPTHSLGKSPIRSTSFEWPAKISSATSMKEAPQRCGNSLFKSTRRVGLRCSQNVCRAPGESTAVDICRQTYWGDSFYTCQHWGTGRAASDPSLLSAEVGDQHFQSVRHFLPP